MLKNIELILNGFYLVFYFSVLLGDQPFTQYFEKLNKFLQVKYLPSTNQRKYGLNFDKEIVNENTNFQLTQQGWDELGQDILSQVFQKVHKVGKANQIHRDKK